MDNLKQQVLSSAKWRIIAQIIHFPIAFLTSVILIRYLSTEDFGNYKIVIGLSGLILYMVSFGIQHSISRFVPEFTERKYYSSIQHLVKIFTVLRFFVIIIVVILLNLFKNQLIVFFNLPHIFARWFWLISIFYILAHTIVVFGQYFHAAYLDIRSITIHDFIKPLLFIVFLIGVTFLDWGFPGILLVLVVCELFSLIYYTISFGKHSNDFQRIHFQHSLKTPPLEWKRIGKYTIYNAIYTFSGIVVGTPFDSFVIAKYLSVNHVALYTFGLGLVTAVHSFNPLTMFKGIFNNIFVRKYTEHKDNNILSFGMSFTIKIGLFVNIPIILTLCILANKIIPIIYKSDYLGSIPVIIVFSIMILSRNFTFGLSTIITTLELVKFFNFFYAIALYNLISAILLVKIFGILGVAIATCSAEIIWFVYLLIIVKSKTSVLIDLPFQSIFRILINAMIGAIFILLVRFIVGNFVSLMAVVIVSTLIYLIASYVNKPFKIEERDLINNLFGKKVWVF